jgi:hypothetical protein
MGGLFGDEDDYWSHWSSSSNSMKKWYSTPIAFY